MAKAEKIRDNRSDRPGELIFGIAISLLLHVVLWLGRDYWLQAVAPRQQPAPEIPVEFVEVPPQETKPPPETSRRAANDSSAGGEAKPQKPLTAVKPAPNTPKTSNSNSPKPSAPKPQPPKAIAPTPPPPKPSLQKPATAPAPPPAQPLPQKTPTTTPPPSPPPKTTAAPATPQPSPSPVAKPSPAPPPLPRTTVPATPQPSPSPVAKPSPTTPPPQRTATAPTTPPRQSPTQKPSTAPVPRQQPKPSPSASSGQAAKPTPRKPAASSGAASKLGGPVSLSSRSLGDPTQAVPNTNRSNQSAAGIDARRDVDLGAYLEQLRQRVRRQWIPGMTQSSRRTVILFAVNRSGQVSQVQIAQPSGFMVTDEAALNAIQRAAPFAPLPADYAGDQIQIRFTFNINVYGELELWGGG